MTFHYDARDRLWTESDRVPNTAGGSFTVTTLVPELGYGLTRATNVRVRIPIHRKVFDERSPAVHRKVEGVGDVELLGTSDLLRESAVPRVWSLQATAGIALPTGKIAPQPFVGQFAPTPLQLGSGTFDPIVGLSIGGRPGFNGSIDVHSAARLVVMENAYQYRSASVFEAGVGGAWFLRGLGASLHVDWSRVTRAEVGGVAAPGTGRDVLYVVPGMSVLVAQQLALGFTARVPMAVRVNETQFVERALFAGHLSWRPPPFRRP